MYVPFRRAALTPGASVSVSLRPRMLARATSLPLRVVRRPLRVARPLNGALPSVAIWTRLPDQATVTTSPDGKTTTYDKIPGNVPEGSSDSVFAGFYLPGDEFGWVSVAFSTA